MKKNITTLVIDLEDRKTYTISLLHNNEPFKYLRITSFTDDDQKHQLKPILSATKERSRLLSNSPFKNYQSNLYLFTYLNPKIHHPLYVHPYLLNNTILYTKNISQLQYHPWDTTEPGHPHFALDTTSIQVSN